MPILRERESNKLVWIILGIIALAGIGGGVYYLATKNWEQKDNSQITVQQLQTQVSKLEQILENLNIS